MSVKILSLVLENGPTEALEKLVMVVIADHADDSGGHAFPGIQLIARKSCQSPRNAMRVLASLEVAGWLTVNRKSHLGKGNSYQLNVSRLRTGMVIGDTVSPVHRNKAASKAGCVVSGDTVSPVLKSGILPMSGDKPGDSQVTNTTDSGDKNAVPFNSINRQEPPREPKASTNPLPPFRGSACVSRSATGENGAKHCDEAVRKVMRELDISNPRMERVIACAIVAFRAKTDDPPDCNAVAENMIARRKGYLEWDRNNLLKYQVGVRKFFADGVWADDRQWVLDKDELRRQRRL